MAWREITEADLLTRISGSELDSLREAALGDGQSDPVSSVIIQITNQVRGYVAACDDNVLGDADTVPESLLGVSLDLILIEIQTRVAGVMIDPEGIREEKMKSAMKILRDVAACKFKVELPDGETAATESDVELNDVRDRDDYNDDSLAGL